MSSETELDSATLHRDANIGHTLISLSSVTLPPDALKNLLENACLCTLREIVFHLNLENIDVRDHSEKNQLLFLARLASKNFHSTCFTDSNNSICIRISLACPELQMCTSNWKVEQLKECASRFIHEANEIPIQDNVKLHLACLAKDLEYVNDLLKEADSKDLKKTSMLFYGISCGEIVDVVVNSGVDVNTKDARRRTPLFYAITSSLDSAKKLLDKGARVTARDKCNVSVLTFFAEKMLKNHLPADVIHGGIELLSQKIKEAQMVKEVINLTLCKFIQVLGTMRRSSIPQDNHLSPSKLCENMRLVLSHTKIGTHNDDINTLVQELQSVQERINNDDDPVSDVLQTFYKLDGANSSAPDSEGNTCLHYATQLLFYGVPEKTVTDLCCELMEHKAKSVDVKNYKKETPLLFCLSSIQLMVRSETSNWSGCLQEVCKLLMVKGRSDICDTTHKEETAFHLILKLCQYAFLSKDENKKRCIFEEMFQILELFSDYPKSINAVNRGDIHLNTPLHLWASLAMKSPSQYCEKVYDDYSFRGILEKLLKLLQKKSGAKLDNRNDKGETPLHVCRTWTAVKLLLDAGAEPDVKDSSGCTPLLAAAKKNTCIKEDSDLFYPDAPNEFWREVLDKKLDPWTADKNGNSVLGILMQKETNYLAKSLIETACDQEAQIDPKVGIPLLIAVCKNRSSGKYWKLDLVKLLLADSRRSLVRCTLGSNKDTALHFSFRNILDLPDSSVKSSVHWEIAKHLLRCGADVDAKGEAGKSCRGLAKRKPPLTELLSWQVDHITLPVVLRNWMRSSESHFEKLSLVARMINYQQVKNLHFHPKTLDKGEDSVSFVFAGIDQQGGREVAVKRIDKSQISPENPESLIVLSVRCEQIVEYILRVEEGNFHYLAFELMEGDLDHYLDKATGAQNATKLCKDLLMGLRFLQSQGVVHGNINPRTVFYQNNPSLCLKLGNCKVHSSRKELPWVAPEVLKQETSFSKESDMFSCGLVLHYLLSDRKYPKDEVDDSLSPEAIHLVQVMLDSDPSNRPSADDAIVHPFFWSKKTKKDFLIAVGNEPEFERGNRHPLTKFEYELEGQFSGIVSCAQWNDPSRYAKISATCAGIPARARQNYNFASVADLIRFIRNVYGHITDHEPNIRDWWNKYCIFDYFPCLIIEVYRKVKDYNLHNSRSQLQRFFSEL